MKHWRPDGWETQPPITDETSMSARRIYEAGADAMLEALMKYRVKMPSDFKPILIIIPHKEAEE